MFSKALDRISAFTLVLLFGGVAVQLGASAVARLAGPCPYSTAVAQQTPDAVSIQPSSNKRPGRQTVNVRVDRSRVRVGEIVRFTLTPGQTIFPITVDFGDGTRVETRQNEVTHRYSATGHYKVYASMASSSNGSDGDNFQRPIPRVSLVVSPTRSLTRTRVTFSAQPSSNYSGIKYRFAFGDGSQTDWQDSPLSIHSYANGGTYLAYVDVGLPERGVWRQVGGSLRQSIVISDQNTIDPNGPDRKDPNDRKDPKELLPGPVRLTATPQPVQTGQAMNFTAQATPTNSSVRYRFSFGDGTSTNWQQGPQVAHSYRAAGKYSASVSLGILRNGTIRSLSNDRARFEVVAASTVQLDFAANPLTVEKGQPVTFSARANVSDSNLRYRFVFGDNSSPTHWQTASESRYSYLEPGNYPAHVEVGRWTNGRVETIGTSDTKMIGVTSPAVAIASPNPSPPASPGTSPSSSPGVLVPVGPVSSPSVSPLRESPTPSSPAGLPDDWWVYLLIALLLIFVAFQFYRALFLPRTTFHANRDVGSSELDAGAKGLSINSQVLLRRNISEGQYLVHTDEPNIVRSVRRENV